MSDSSFFTAMDALDVQSDFPTKYNADLGKSKIPTMVDVSFAGSPLTLSEDADVVIINATAGNVTVNLPATPQDGDEYHVVQFDATANTRTIGRNGKTINGAASDDTMATQWQRRIYTWSSAANTWLRTTIAP